MPPGGAAWWHHRVRDQLRVPIIQRISIVATPAESLPSEPSGKSFEVPYAPGGKRAIPEKTKKERRKI